MFDNDLAEGRLVTGGDPVSLTDICVPIFTVGTERDHVVPWRSTYKINLQTETEVPSLHRLGWAHQKRVFPRLPRRRAVTCFCNSYD
jgi:hypothetical protein